mmetsp:Transcript_27661/g.83427  ORF Transcript_27661/g.83427 Transcript_27661/m.83427 type:complete len:290 (-) Transcript_27661:1239-2108(-)
MLGGVRLFEEPGVGLHARLLAVPVQLPQQRFRHHLGGNALLVHRKRSTRRIARANVAVHRVGDPGHVRRLRQVVARPAGPDEDVVGQVADDVVRLFLRVRQAAPQCGDVLVIPRVPIGDRCPVADAVDLVAVIPPRHDARILGRVVSEPPISLSVIVDDLLCAAHPAHEHDGRRGHRFTQPVAIEVKVDAAVQDGEKDHDRGDAADERHLVVHVDERLEHLLQDPLERPRVLGRAFLLRLAFARGLGLGLGLHVAAGRRLGRQLGLEFLEHLAQLAERPFDQACDRHSA